jgi:hypothetical protein
LNICFYRSSRYYEFYLPKGNKKILFSNKWSRIFVWSENFFLPLPRKLGGARSGGAEIIPLQPDADNAAVGKLVKFLLSPFFIILKLNFI